MQKIILIIAGILGGAAVGIGAFGAHALKGLLEKTGKSEVFETAVKYHFWHVLALLAVALLMEKYTSTFLTYSAWLFISGILIFSGSLYILSLTGISKLGAITPIGGLAFLLGWMFLVLAVIKS
jgi:uncharacterized membrane protein YgdD (TMEM256/DUF423 family)